MFNNVMTGLTADTAPDVADSLLTYDASGTAAKTTTITNFYKTINALTADATPDGAADYVATYDASASGGKKVLIQNLAATQAQQEAGTAITNFVTPGRQHFHPSAAKAWCTFDGSTAGTNAPTAGYNVTSVTRNAAGNYTINFTTAFSAATYAVSGWCQSVTAATGGIVTADPGDTKSTTALQIRARRSDTSGAIDSTVITVVCFGDFA